MTPSYAGFGFLKSKNRKKCEKVGGVYNKKDKKCFCSRGKGSWRIIDPFKRTCEVEKRYIQKVEQEKLKCVLPSEWYCSKKLNQKYDHKFKIAQEDYIYNYRIFNKKYYKQFDSNKKLTNKEIEMKNTQFSNYLYSKYFTKERSLKVQKIFNNAKLDLLQFLKVSLDKENAENLTKIIKPISLSFGKVQSLTEQPYYSYEARYYKGKVYIQAYILHHESPGFLYYTILHELAHAIDPCSYGKFDFSYKNNSFKNVLECLHDKKSVEARRTDVQCLQSYVNKRIKAGKKPNALAVSTLESAKAGKVCAMVGIPSNALESGEVGCVGNQINESFSDWLATEVFFSTKGSNIEQLEEYLSSAVGMFCENNNSLKALQRSAQIRNNGHGYHLHSLDRINGIMLNHPVYKKINQCRQNSGKSLRNNLINLLTIEELSNYSTYSNYCSFP